jgi:hypothetical protein
MGLLKEAKFSTKIFFVRRFAQACKVVEAVKINSTDFLLQVVDFISCPRNIHRWAGSTKSPLKPKTVRNLNKWIGNLCIFGK